MGVELGVWGSVCGGVHCFRLSATVSGHHSAWQCGRTLGSLADTEGAVEAAEEIRREGGGEEEESRGGEREGGGEREKR